MINEKKTKNVLNDLLSKIDKVALKKTSNRMMIALKIGNALKNSGLSQKEFAKRLHKSESEVSSWLSGDRNFTIDTLTEISLMLNISLLDTSMNNVCTLPSTVFLPIKDKGTNAEISMKSQWTCHLGYIDCKSKVQKVG